MLNRVLLSIALLACGSNTSAQEKKTIEDQKVCPIMINKEVNAESEVVEYQGIKIRMCCDTCTERFNKYPEAYLNEKYIPQLNGLAVPERKIAQTFCPVYPDRVVTEKDPFVMYKEQKVYLFNKAAVKKWQKNPEKYAKVKWLPQLANTGAATESEIQDSGPPEQADDAPEAEADSDEDGEESDDDGIAPVH